MFIRSLTAEFLILQAEKFSSAKTGWAFNIFFYFCISYFNDSEWVLCKGTFLEKKKISGFYGAL